MGKDLESIADNTRIVLFEKHQIYYFKTKFGECLEGCTAKNRGIELDEGYVRYVGIGSGACIQCVYNKGFNHKKNYIICKNLVNVIPSITIRGFMEQ